MPSSPTADRRRPRQQLRRRASAIAVAVAWAIGHGGVASASDHADHDEPAAAKGGHGAVAKPAVAKADAPAGGRGGAAQQSPDAAAASGKAPARGAATAARDPMDLVRERLAEKLGATKPPEVPNPNVLRITSRASSTETAPARVAAGHTDGGHGGGRSTPARVSNNNRPATLAAVNRELAGGHAGHAADAPAASLAAPLPLPSHWDYQGAGGPEAWGQLKPEFSKCSSGTRQSPIDIRDGVKVQLDEVRFDYKPSGFRVIDNGHTVQVNVASGNSIEVLGRRYDLLQFHFHRPSEERINGRQFEMVAHLVHKDLEGRLAVVAVLLDRGAAQPVIQSVWNNLPLEKGEEVAAQVSLDLNALLPPDRSYYTYMGSLTTPPCSEGVLWMVLKNPVQVSPQQVSIFSRLYPMNARPIQSASGRLIKESN